MRVDTAPKTLVAGGLLLINMILALFIIVLPARAGSIPIGEHCGIYDVIVVGSEPEGVAAAVAAAESGSRTLLVTRDTRVGGLFTLGQMNVLDLRTQPFHYQLGLFDRFWRQVGRRHSFDVVRAQEAFDDLLEGAGVTVSTGAGELRPLMRDRRIVGVGLGATSHFATAFIDATAEMEFAAAAGAGYTVGFESIGVDARMADTLVFRIAGVDWQELAAGIRERGAAYASIDNWVAWGHFDRHPEKYESSQPGLRMRGLNLGRQEDGTLLVNALLVYGVDPFDPDSLAEGVRRAELEAPQVVEHLSREIPGFGNATYAGAASRLYVRESRHLQAECILTVDDVLDNRVTLLDVAAGGYPLDVQTLTPADSGFVYGVPEIYGVRLCSAVPREVDSLWVVGKAAGFDPLAASSARVVPFGMAFGEAVGVAAARAAEAEVQPRLFAADSSGIASLRSELLERGAVLPEVADRDPVGPHEHPAYRDYRLLLSRGLALGGYDNDPLLDAPVQALGFVYLLANVATRFLDEPAVALQLVTSAGQPEGQLDMSGAESIMNEACALYSECSTEAGQVLNALAVIDGPGGTEGPLTRGQMYRLAVALLLESAD